MSTVSCRLIALRTPHAFSFARWCRLPLRFWVAKAATLDWCPPGVLVGIVHLRVPEPNTAGLSQGIGVTGLRSEGGAAVPIGLVKVSCFPCVVNQWPSGPIDPWMRGGLRAWVIHSLGAPTATAAINAFFRDVRMRVLENLDHSSG